MLRLPAEAPSALLVLAHGAGAGYRHQNLEALTSALALRAVATFRFNFPFMQAGRRRVDSTAVAVSALVSAEAVARSLLPGVACFVGGHSFGGRMATHAVADGLATTALVLCAFPLHPRGKPGRQRAAHLSRIAVPLLFLSGDRDELAQPSLLSAVVNELPGARLHVLSTADHGYRVRKRERKDPRSVFEEMADETAAFVQRVLPKP